MGENMKDIVVEDLEFPTIDNVDLNWGNESDFKNKIIEVPKEKAEHSEKGASEGKLQMSSVKESEIENTNTKLSNFEEVIEKVVNTEKLELEDGPNTINFEHALHLAAKHYTRQDALPFNVWVETIKRLIDMGKRYTRPFIPSHEQYRAILTTSKRVLIDACPGSGKTTTLMHKIFFDGQVLDKKAKQLALTYTKAAADNMNLTYGKLCKRYRLDNTVEFGTIHAFAYKVETWVTGSDVLTPGGINKVIKTGPIVNDDDSFSWDMDDDGELADNEELIWLHNTDIIAKAVESLGYSRNYQSHMTRIEGWLNVVIERMIKTQEELLRLEEFNELGFVNIEELLNILRVSRGIRSSYDVVDFSDMLVNFYERLKGYESIEDIEDTYIKSLLKMTHIYVDEFQDISPLQWEIIVELLRLNKDSSLYCVGDADQAIYSFRGADSKYLVQFNEHVENEIIKEDDVDIIFFTLNRRSGKDIVNLTSEFIQTNEFRYDKRMHSYEDRDSNIRIIPDPTKTGKLARDLVLSDLDEIRRADPSKYDYSEIGILYREHQQSFFLMVDAVENGFPINIGSDYYPSFFPEVSDILGIWEMLLNSKSPQLLERYLYKCMQGLNKEKSAYVANRVRQTGKPFSEFIAGTDVLKQDILDLRAIYKALTVGDIASAIDKTCYKYFNAYLRMFNHRHWKLDVANYYLSKWTSMSYIELTAKHRETKEWIGRYNKNIYGIQFKTIHSSKGLEYDDVYILPIGDSVTPKKKILNKMTGQHKIDYVEEERRLLYVALSRAKVNLTMFAEKLTDLFPAEVYEINTKQSLTR